MHENSGSDGSFSDCAQTRKCPVQPRIVPILLCGFPADLLATALTCQRLLDAFLFSGLEIERVFLNFLDDVFLLNLTLESP